MPVGQPAEVEPHSLNRAESKMNPYYIVVPLVVIIAVAAIILVALLRKGDVTAACSLRSFAFTLHAKDRMSDRGSSEKKK